MAASASYELRTFLASIAKQLKETRSSKGKIVERLTSDGREFSWIPDPPDSNGLSDVSFANVRVEQWRELGLILERVAGGEDARQLFGQDKRTKPSKIGEHRLRALAYWSVRARAPSASDTGAMTLARSIISPSAKLTAATVRKYAQRHRERCLVLLSGRADWVAHFESSEIRIRLLGQSILPLLSYLRKKSSRGGLPKSSKFERLSDALFHAPQRTDGGLSIQEPAFPGMSLHME